VTRSRNVRTHTVSRGNRAASSPISSRRTCFQVPCSSGGNREPQNSLSCTLVRSRKSAGSPTSTSVRVHCVAYLACRSASHWAVSSVFCISRWSLYEHHSIRFALRRVNGVSGCEGNARRSARCKRLAQRITDPFSTHGSDMIKSVILERGPVGQHARCLMRRNLPKSNSIAAISSFWVEG